MNEVFEFDETRACKYIYTCIYITSDIHKY